MSVLLPYVLASLLATQPGSAGDVVAIDANTLAWFGDTQTASFREISTRLLGGTGQDAAKYQLALDGLEARFQEFLQAKLNSAQPRDRCQQLAEFLFVVEGFEADSNLIVMENLLPNGVLSRRRGYCLGLCMVLLELGERLNWPLVPVAVPRHTFIRHEATANGEACNFETLRNGAAVDDEFYRDQLATAGVTTTTKLLPLSKRDFMAHLLNNHAYVLLSHGKIDAARAEIVVALKLSPTLVEAQINLGVCEANERNYPRAIELFTQALTVWPRDIALRVNRVNALLALGKLPESRQEFVALLSEHAQHALVTAAAEKVLASIHPVREWNQRQRFSQELERAQLAVFKRSRGLQGAYFRGAGFETKVLTRTDLDISFNWEFGGPTPSLPRDNFSARWEGGIEVPDDDQYTFFVICSDGVRVWVDGRSVVDSWRRSNDNLVQTEVDLIAGPHRFQIDYFESIGQAGIKLMLGAKRHKELLPVAEYLYSIDLNSPKK
ncbi:MAG: PA14 domain-containing protein [Planctomycetota bacterium]